MAESKSFNAAKIGWTDTWDLVEVPEHENGGRTDIGAFDTECPCCGQVISFRIFCEATAQETESDR